MEKQKLVETVFGTLKAPKIVEGTEAKSNVWTASIWLLDKLNLNGRVYPTKLGQRIVTENKVTPVCDGHEPDYHLDFLNYKAVSKNPRIENTELVVDIVVIDDDYNSHLLRLAKEGVRIGVSSVGYGDCDKDGVVDANTYELIRYCDFVTAPAGNVYAEPKKDNDNNSNKPKSESVEALGDGSTGPGLSEEISRIKEAREIRISRRK